jgi:prepilin-type N-terminal cleavage/methylation domain-containing protein
MAKLSERGFTLIEMLIVIGIIAILAAAVIIAINPARQFAQSRNTQRWTATNAILNSVHQNMVDNRGTFDFSGCPATAFPTSATNVGSGGTDLDLCACITPTYMAEMPYDPVNGSFTDCSTYDTDFTLLESTGGRITVAAPSAEIGETISVTR